jgi:uncharacterized protein (TIGR00255 family)
LALGFLKQARSVTETAGVSDEGLAQAIFSLDEVWQTSQEEINDDLKKAVLFCLEEAITKFNEFRFEEGRALGNFFDGALERMTELSAKVPGFAAERIEKQKEKFALQLQNWANEVSFDKNRMEQELIYYFEKWDVTEEITRLAQHLSYFKDTMHEENAGRKLGFITQEIGREINTIGSKANHAEMQKVVVLMKDELEKIKEQLLNVL